MSELVKSFNKSRSINKNDVLQKNYDYMVEVFDLLNLLMPNEITKVKITENDDRIYIAEDCNNSRLSNSFTNNCDRNEIILQILKLLVMLERLIGCDMCFNSTNFIINEMEELMLCNWCDKLLRNEKLSQSEYCSSIALLFYEIIEEENINKNIYKSVYEMAKNTIKLSSENRKYEKLLINLMNNKILLEEIELELENEYEDNNNDEYNSKRIREFKESELYYDSYHPIETMVKKWISTEVNNIINKNSDEIELWNCSISAYEIEYLFDRSRLFCNLKLLDLSCNRIDDKGFGFLCNNYKYLNKIEKLYVNSNKIGDLGMTYFCDNCSFLSYLKFFSLPNNRITDVGGIELAEHINKCENLECLWIYWNRILNYESLQKIIQKNHPNKALKIVIYFEYEDEEEGTNNCDDS